MTQITGWLLVLVAALGGFYGGFRYEKGQVPAVATTTTTTTNSGQGTTVGGGGGGFGGGFGGGAGGGFGRGTAGKVTSLDGNTLTITDNQGQKVTVQLSDSTVIEKTVSAGKTDLASGATVTVQGQRGTDGSVSATTIIITAAASS